jgi:hypothetical protein
VHHLFVDPVCLNHRLVPLGSLIHLQGYISITTHHQLSFQINNNESINTGWVRVGLRLNLLMSFSEGEVVYFDEVGACEVMDNAIAHGDSCVPNEWQKP